MLRILRRNIHKLSIFMQIVGNLIQNLLRFALQNTLQNLILNLCHFFLSEMDNGWFGWNCCVLSISICSKEVLQDEVEEQQPLQREKSAF